MVIPDPIRIAMWSGPRNISTALMRSFGTRPDTAVVDEPLYAAYLAGSGSMHPMRAEVLASQPNDWRDVVTNLLGPVPDGKAIYYQKHMTHHMLDSFGREWIGRMHNCFLIRDPREVILSYIKKSDDPALEDLGYVQQCQIFDFVLSIKNVQAPVKGKVDLSLKDSLVRLVDAYLGATRRFCLETIVAVPNSQATLQA